MIDEFVDIRWWQAVVPFGGTYQPLWLGLGALSLDLTAVVVATSLARGRLSARAWARLHLTAYAAWAVGVLHGIGTDTATPWLALTDVGCVAFVALAASARVVAVVRGRRRAGYRPTQPGTQQARVRVSAEPS